MSETAPDTMYHTEFLDSFSQEVWESTYKYYKDKELDDTFDRIARYVASAEDGEDKQEMWYLNFKQMLSGFSCTAAGRIYANAGTEFAGTTMLNCFVGPRRDYDIDSIDGILSDVLNQCQTLKSEGGWGQNFSFIRPRGAFIGGVGVESPGAIKFMEIYDKTSDVVTSGAGKKSVNKKAKKKIRKGAMMAVLDCWHPDVEEFIRAKQQPGRLTKFNMSVNCTDDFMQRIVKINELGKDHEDFEELDKWDLKFPDTEENRYNDDWNGNIKDWEENGNAVIVYKTISASALWDTIMESTYKRNEPGVLFLDRANYFSPLGYYDTIMATNPCITGDTIVAMADGRHNLTIKELAEDGKDVQVYCLDDNNNIVVRTMRHPRITGYGKDIYEVKLDDGSSIKCTDNHKFKLRNGDYVEASKLVKGDSLHIMTKFKSTFNEIFKDSSRKDIEYMWINNGKTRTFSEHRIIAESTYGKISSGNVVHHRDFNSLNNSPDNLLVMSTDDHKLLHAENMMGDKNPMRRAQHEWSEEKWDEYRSNMSDATRGEKNGRFNGISNDDYQVHAIDLCNRLGRRFGTKEWKKYCKDIGIPIPNDYRIYDRFPSFLDFSIWAARESGIDDELLMLDPRQQKTINNLMEQGYYAKIINGEVHVEKECEVCHNDFFVHHGHREISHCSQSCSNESLKKRNRDSELNAQRAESLHNTFEERKENDRVLQSQVYNDLKFDLGRAPMKKEWEQECKIRGIRFRIGKQSPFRKYSDVVEFSLNLNHRVVSVEMIGRDDVYNGTVDEFHNFFIGGFESQTKSGKPKWQYVNTSNCGEQTLPPGGVCNLGSVNATQFVLPDKSGFDIPRVRQYVRFLVRFLDNINSISYAPLKEYVDSMRDKRRIGVGLLGWASALLMLNVRFGGRNASELREQLVGNIAREAYMASIDLAEEKGMFRYCDPVKHAEGVFVKSLELPEDYMHKLRTFGIRNSSLLSCQPTGNTSCFANVVSGGIEPVFSPEYIRTAIENTIPDDIKDVTPLFYEGEWHETDMFSFAKEGDEKILRGIGPDGTVYKIDKNRGLTKEIPCMDYGVRWLADRGEWDPNAEWAITANDLTAEEHLEDLKGFARWVDSAISKTINLPNEYLFEDFKNIYLSAYKSGYIKGVTTYRTGTMASVLSVSDDKMAEEADEEIIMDDVTVPPQTPAVVTTIRAEGKKWYLTTIMDESQKRPIAFFVHTNHHEKSVTSHDAVEKLLELAKSKGIPQKWIDDTIAKVNVDNNATKIARSISLNLRHGVLIKNVCSVLTDIEDVFVGTFLFQIRKYLMTWIKDGEEVTNGNGASKCPECGGQMIYREGCCVCRDCSYSKCG